METKRVMNVLCYYVLPILIISLSFIFTNFRYFNLTGRIAEVLLILILFVKPVAILTNRLFLRKFLAYRRQLGVLIFWLTLIHTIGFIYLFKMFKFSDFLGFKNHAFWGMLATIGMIVLGITSNKFSLLLLKQNWKKLQYLAYPVLFATLLHIGIVSNEMRLFYILTTTFTILKILEFIKRNKQKT